MGQGVERHRIRHQAGGGFPEEEQHPEKASGQADPAYGVFRTPGSDQSADQGESEKGYEEYQIVDSAPRARRLRGWGTVQGQRGQPSARDEHGHREGSDDPGQPGGDAGAHPTDFLTLFSCPFGHSATVYHYRL